MPVQKRLSVVGFARQLVAGVPTAAPAIAIGVTDGNVAQVDLDEAGIEQTWSNRVLQAAERKGALAKASFGFVCTPAATSFLMLAALGSEVVTGTAPYVHTDTLAAALGLNTVWGRLGTDWVRLDDCKVNTLELTWDGPGALRGKVELIGCNWTGSIAAPTPTLSESPQAGYLAGAGGAFDVAGAGVRVTKGSLKIDNKAAPVPIANKVLPDVIYEGMVDVTTSLTVVPDDLNLFRLAVTGNTAGTAVANRPTTTSLHQKWIMDANTDLDVLQPVARVAIGWPDSDPSGGPAELTLEGQMLQPPGATAPITAIVRNAAAAH